MEQDLRLLLIEDNEDDALLLVRHLEREGCRVRWERVETGAAMTEALQREVWDLVISDYSLPHFSAPQALALFREQGRDIPFIVVSGAVGEDAAVALMKAGAHDFVTKDNLKRVVPAVKRELAEAENRRRRRQAEEEKGQLHAQLLQAQKMEAIGVLTAGVAHDFNNIIGAIQIYADLAQMKAAKGDSVQNEMQQILSSLNRAAGLARQLLLFSRKQPMELVPFDLNRIIADLMKMLRRIIGEDVEVKTEFAADLWRVLGDAGGVEQVIMNLAVNARDAMPGGGTITIATRNEVFDEEFCRSVVEARPGRYVCLSVQDTGSGMDEETRNRVFEPFFTTKEAGKGTGLGLAVVYGIVKQHQGWINLRSDPGKGTRFDIYLPSLAGDEARATGKKTAFEGLRGAGERILVVEDEEGFLGVTTEALRSSGYEVTAAVGVREAWERFERDPEGFDALFSDVVLQDGNGLDLARRCLEKKPALKVLITSGYTDDRSRLVSIREGQIPFLAKPFSFSALLIALKDVLRGKEPP